MNAKSTSYFIEILDNGFVVKEGGKKIAVEKSEDVSAMIIGFLQTNMPPLNKAGLNNLVVNISIDSNVPNVSSR